MVETLKSKAKAWEMERGTEFLYDGVSAGVLYDGKRNRVLTLYCVVINSFLLFLLFRLVLCPLLNSTVT